MVATGLSRLGPRPDGAKSQDQAALFLMEAMVRAGLQNVRTVPVPGKPSVANITGVLPGTTGREIVLSAHYDTVAKSPGAADDASGCGVVIAAAAELARMPRRHAVRVVLFDGEETGLLGSRGWLASLSDSARARIVANVNLEMVGWAGSTGPTVHAIPVVVKKGLRAEKGERITTPDWLVRTVLEAGEAVGWRLHVADPRFSLPMQMLLRSTRVRFGADSNAFQEMDVPAVTLSDSSFFAMDPTYHRPADTPDRLDAARLEQWMRTVVITVRRLDALERRPADEDEYLVLAGRVWPEWGLGVVGLVLWGLLQLRHRRDRSWPFPWLMALAWVAAPELAFPLLLLPALLAFIPPARRWVRVLWVLLGLVPFLLYLLLLAGAWSRGLSSWKSGFLESWTGAALVVIALVAWVLSLKYPLGSGRRDAAPEDAPLVAGM